MGAFARAVQSHLRDALADAHSDLDWETEYRIAGTPVDLAGRSSTGVAGASPEHLALVELEWRRADPADNAAKLFRHLAEGTVNADRATVCQVFSGYYDLADGGVSAKRLNAEFVGRSVADVLDDLTYRALDLDLDPPKRGGERPPPGLASGR
jgi:hypothetical protein